MFARLVTFNLQPGNLRATEKVAEEHGPVMRRLHGFSSVTFLHNDDLGEYGSFSLWDTKEDAEAVSGIAELQVKQAFKDIMKGRPSIRIFEVYNTKN